MKQGLIYFLEEGLTLDTYLHHLTTEEVNQHTLSIDECSTEEILGRINEEDALVPLAVRREIPNIARSVEIIYDSLKNGGRLFYIGAGTSGRLGVLDASECPPTFGTEPDMVQGIIAGGDIALRVAVEGGEDNSEAGVKVIEDYKISKGDVIVGITASGSASFVLAALAEAKAKGVKTIGVTNNNGSKLSNYCDVCIAPIVGPEVIIGSTRMKSGTAQKLVLNMLTTSVMIKLGKTYGNLMVDLKASNIKLKDRAKRIISHATGVDYDIAGKYLEKVNGDTKLAILLIMTQLEAEEGKSLLQRHGGSLKQAIAEVN